MKRKIKWVSLILVVCSGIVTGYSSLSNPPSNYHYNKKDNIISGSNSWKICVFCNGAGKVNYRGSGVANE